MNILSKEDQKRCKVIKYILNQDVVDMTELRKHAIKGLLTDEIRKQAWPKLLGLNLVSIKSEYNYYCDTTTKKSVYPLCREHDQIEKDVARSMWRHGPNINQKRLQLDRLLNWVMLRNEQYHYFQGLHDIATVILLVCGESMAGPMLAQMMKFHLREYVNKDVEGVTKVLKLIHPLIQIEDTELGNHMQQAEITRGIYALSWVLTWFSHPLDSDLPLTTRLFDFFLAAHPLSPMYMSTALIMYRKKDVLAVNPEFTEVFCVLSNLPTNIPWESIIITTLELFKKYKPRQVYQIAKMVWEPTFSLVNYPYPYMDEPQYSDRYWLLYGDTNPKKRKRHPNHSNSLIQTNNRSNQAANYAFYALGFTVTALSYLVYST